MALAGRTSSGRLRSALLGGAAIAAGGGNFEAGNQSHDSLEDFGAYIASFADADTAPTAGGTLTINGAALGSYDYAVIDGNTTLDQTAADAVFTATADSRSAIIVCKGDLEVPVGVLLKPSVRKLFAFLYVTGNLVVGGEISMTARGANHSAGGSNIAAAAIRIINDTHDGVENPEVPAAGADGGAAQAANAAGNPGAAGTAGQTGGGGSGGAHSGGASGPGADGTSFGGGPAGGGYATDNDATGGAPLGGPGGDGGGVTGIANRATGAGAGNPAGTSFVLSDGAVASAAVNGTGGVLVIICLGQLSGAGTITAHGSAGASVTGTSRSAGGGGSGGGSITILFGTDASSITPAATGGAGGTGARAGGAGGAGTARKLDLFF